MNSTLNEIREKISSCDSAILDNINNRIAQLDKVTAVKIEMYVDRYIYINPIREYEVMCRYTNFAKENDISIDLAKNICRNLISCANVHEQSNLTIFLLDSIDKIGYSIATGYYPIVKNIEYYNKNNISTINTDNNHSIFVLDENQIEIAKFLNDCNYKIYHIEYVNEKALFFAARIKESDKKDDMNVIFLNLKNNKIEIFQSNNFSDLNSNEGYLYLGSSMPRI